MVAIVFLIGIPPMPKYKQNPLVVITFNFRLGWPTKINYGSSTVHGKMYDKYLVL